jgi:imidazole glycerol-phosphate synthase subunit HisH
MIAIINYRAGNLRSVERALANLGLACAITSDPDRIREADRVIFPGVGAAGRAMETIRDLGLDTVIREVIRMGRPFLGICLGTQVILETSEEDSASCLGIIPGTVKRFTDTGEKIPHMGWNTLTMHLNHPVFEGIDRAAQFYFVHSYYPAPSRQEDVVAWTSYGIDFASVIARDNVVATQFHPEKSGGQGLMILKNFSLWKGKWMGSMNP